MGQEAGDPVLQVVAGCLFEVSLGEAGYKPWEWVNPQPQVTLVSRAAGLDVQHFRFRAEPSAAETGAVNLRFRSENAVGAIVVRAIVVRVAPGQR